MQQNVEAVDKPGYSLYHCTVLKRIVTPTPHAANAAVCFNNMHLSKLIPGGLDEDSSLPWWQFPIFQAGKPTLKPQVLLPLILSRFVQIPLSAVTLCTVCEVSVQK